MNTGDDDYDGHSSAAFAALRPARRHEVKYYDAITGIDSANMRRAVAERFAEAKKAVRAINGYFGREVFDEDKPTIKVCEETDYDYANDGETRVPGTAYRVMIAYTLAGFAGAESPQCDFQDVYQGRGNGDGSLVFFVHGGRRDSDDRLRDVFTDVYWRGYAEKQERVAYGHWVVKLADDPDAVSVLSVICQRIDEYRAETKRRALLRAVVAEQKAARFER